MRIKVSLPVADADKLREKILESAEKIEQDETSQTDWEIVCLGYTHSGDVSLHVGLDDVN
jgi:hypothetical protein